jgi:hypothetical protein
MAQHNGTGMFHCKRMNHTSESVASGARLLFPTENGSKHMAAPQTASGC